MEQKHEHEHVPSFRTDILVWVALLVLTTITIFASFATQGTTVLAVSIAMGIATIKATAVLLYYMHLKYDHFIYKIFIGIIIVLFSSFMALMIIDYAYR